MHLKDIDLNKLAAEMRSIAEAWPHVVYNDGLIDEGNGCTYHACHRNPFGCLVGAALDNLGLDVNDIGNGLEQYSGIATNLSRNNFDVTSPIAQWIISVQTAQDSRCSWGEAIATADKLVN